MMIRAFTVAATLAAAGSAQAAFVGFDMRLDADATASAQAVAGLGDAQVYRMYAVFSQAGQVLLNVANMNFNVQSGTLFQSPAPFGGNLAPNSGFFGFDATLQWDSFVTINELSNTGSTTIAVDPDFAWTSTGVAAGGWFNSNPPNQQGLAGFNADFGHWETLLGQFTVIGMAARNVEGPNSSRDGNWFGLGTAIWNTGIGTETFVVENAGFIPTPGSMALFGLAGLAAIRRRR
jgi:uncharacterized protein (TIGR03382 family)